MAVDHGARRTANPQLDRLVVRRGDGRVVRFGFQRHSLTPGGPSSPAVKAILDRYLAAR
jgi:hypothetical protein